MIDFKDYSDEILIARGKYSILLKEQKLQKKLLCDLNQNLTSCTTLICARMQPKFNDVPQNVDNLLDSANSIIEQIAICTQKIISLAQQMDDIFTIAWPDFKG